MSYANCCVCCAGICSVHCAYVLGPSVLRFNWWGWDQDEVSLIESVCLLQSGFGWRLLRKLNTLFPIPCWFQTSEGRCAEQEFCHSEGSSKSRLWIHFVLETKYLVEKWKFIFLFWIMLMSKSLSLSMRCRQPSSLVPCQWRLRKSKNCTRQLFTRPTDTMWQQHSQSTF